MLPQGPNRPFRIASYPSELPQGATGTNNLKRQGTHDSDYFAPRKQRKPLGIVQPGLKNPEEIRLGRKRRLAAASVDPVSETLSSEVTDACKEEDKLVKAKPGGSKYAKKSRKQTPLEVGADVYPECRSISCFQGILGPLSVVVPPPRDIPADVDNLYERYLDEFHGQDIAQDVMNYLYELEKRYKLPISYFDREGQITPHMRSVLIDWIIQVQNHLGLLQETLYLTVTLIDRFLMARRISMTNLQLVGITALFIISKLEERCPPEIRKLIHLTDDSYKYHEMIHMERLILTAMRFDLIMAEPMVFLNRFMQTIEEDKTVENLSKYLMDIILPEKETAVVLPSNLAAAALCLARHLLQGKTDGGNWNKTLTFYSRYEEKDLQPLMRRMANALLHVDTSPLQGSRTKYESVTRYKGVSKSPAVSASNLQPVIHKLSNISS